MHDAQTLYELLPAIDRIRDAEQGYPLRALFSVIAQQSLMLDENLAQLYDDLFIETAGEWAVPYLGDLIGVRGVYARATKAGSARAEVANTIGYRRRKGTAAMLEQLARDVTGWSARVVEFFQWLITSQYSNHIRLTNHAAPDLRQWDKLEYTNTPFDTLARSSEVRRIGSGRGKYNIPNIGLFLYRINAYALTNSPAAKLNNNPADQRYFFDPLKRDMPLFNDPTSEDEITSLAQPINVPAPISRRVLHEDITTTQALLLAGQNAESSYYATTRDHSIAIETDTPTPVMQIVVCDLSDAGASWAHQPKPNTVAIDPKLGRLAFGSAPAQPPRVSFHYGFSADMGGGEYARSATFDPDLPVQALAPGADVQNALNALTTNGAIEIADSGRYAQTLSINTNAQQRIELRAKDEARPFIALAGDMTIQGGVESEVTLNGLLIAGGAINISGRIRSVTLRHCTLAPGASPTLNINTTDVTVTLDHCIAGAIRAVKGCEVVVQDSIVDALDEGGVAFAAADAKGAGGNLTATNSTIIGKIHAEAMPLISNSILLAALATGDGWQFPVHSERTQEGCVRFSFVPLDARVPRKFACQPVDEASAAGVTPQFTSLRFGDPGYMQLSLRTPMTIRAGADDEAEMGAFHDLYQPQRETNLRVRLDEYLRFSLEAGIFYVS